MSRSEIPLFSGSENSELFLVIDILIEGKERRV